MPSVIAVIVTHKRPAELQRLLDGLARSEMPLTGCVISDHAPDGSTKAMAATTPWPTIVLEDPSNPGPGAGWANAAQEALRHFPVLDAIWYLDDDVVNAPSDLGLLWQEMEGGQAGAIAPLLEDSKGQLWAFPEPVDRSARRKIRDARTPAEALDLLGSEPQAFCWCTGACFLVGRPALESTGFHRTDFWMLGEDLEYSMRIAARNRAVFSCRVSIPHLPPQKKDDLTQSAPRRRQLENKTEETPSQSDIRHRPATDASQRPGSQSAIEESRRASYLKFCSLLQNLSYLAFHSRESRHMKSYLPGNFRRFFRSNGFRWATIRDAFLCFWNGALRSQPAGARSGQLLRQRILSHGN